MNILTILCWHNGIILVPSQQRVDLLFTIATCVLCKMGRMWRININQTEGRIEKKRVRIKWHWSGRDMEKITLLVLLAGYARHIPPLHLCVAHKKNYRFATLSTRAIIFINYQIINLFTKSSRCWLMEAYISTKYAAAKHQKHFPFSSSPLVTSRLLLRFSENWSDARARLFPGSILVAGCLARGSTGVLMYDQ
jgi:hypothetical protein